MLDAEIAIEIADVQGETLAVNGVSQARLRLVKGGDEYFAKSSETSVPESEVPSR
jgi:hypothetical protein